MQHLLVFPVCGAFVPSQVSFTVSYVAKTKFGEIGGRDAMPHLEDLQ